MSLWTDSNGAEKADDGRLCPESRSCCGAVKAWMSLTQRRTVVAEYISTGGEVKRGVVTKGVPFFLVRDLSRRCFDLLVNRTGAISLATNPLSSARTRQIDVRFKFVRELVRSRTISPTAADQQRRYSHQGSRRALAS